MSAAGGRIRPIAAALLVLSAMACGSDEGVATGSTTTDRPPLDSPPDPGPIPLRHGVDEALLAEVLESTVGVRGVACGRMSTGSGFSVADDLIATNAHVIVGVDEITITTLDGRELPGAAAAYDPDRDLALLRVEGADLTPLPLGDAVDHTIGALIGWDSDGVPDPAPFRIDRPVTVRIESVGSDERVERPSWLLAARVESGDSGAALVDTRGNAVGIAFATSTEGPGVGYAIRASELGDLIAEGLDPNLVVPDC